MWPPAASVATVIFSRWRLTPNGQRWTSDRDPGSITHPPFNYSFYCGRSARNAHRLLEACYLMLHMIPINPCDCGHKNVSDNSGCLTLWCPLHLTLDVAFSPRLQPVEQTEAGFPELSSVVRVENIGLLPAPCIFPVQAPLGASLSSPFYLLIGKCV